MVDETAPADEALPTVELDCFLPYPAGAVWKAITNAAALTDWLMASDFVPDVGHRFTFNCDALFGDGATSCEVLALEPERRLSYSWQNADADTVVTWLLIPSTFGTHVCLWQRGIHLRKPGALEGLERAWDGKLPVALRRYLDRHSPDHDPQVQPGIGRGQVTRGRQLSA